MIIKLFTRSSSLDDPYQKLIKNFKEYFGGPGGPVLMVKDICQDFFWKIFETMGDNAQERTKQLFHDGYYSVAGDKVMDRMKLILSLQKRTMLKIWTEPDSITVR